MFTAMTDTSRAKSAQRGIIMKRDMDLFRVLLLKIEEQPFVASGYFPKPTIEGFSEEEICYHAQLAKDAGFIEATFLPQTTEFMVKRLTFAGHEFLDAAREEKLWNKAKQTVLHNAGTLTVEALKTALSMLMQQAARGMIG
jgi:hypothetical protein